MPSENNIHYSEGFKNELRKCRLFKLKYPRGGQYNDGYQLLGKLVLSDEKKLIKTLNTMGVEYTLHYKKPENWCPPPFIVDSKKCWIEYDNYVQCFGFNTYITIGTTDFSIEFNFNSTSWYEVVIDDIKQAICFENVLDFHDLL